MDGLITLARGRRWLALPILVSGVGLTVPAWAQDQDILEVNILSNSAGTSEPGFVNWEPTARPEFSFRMHPQPPSATPA